MRETEREAERVTHTDTTTTTATTRQKLGALTELPLNCRAIGVKSLTMNCNEPA
jgi:hypothetical protein